MPVGTLMFCLPPFGAGPCFQGGMPVLGFRVSAGRVVGVQISLRVWWICSKSSGVASHGDAWEEMSIGLEESSSLGENGTLRGADTGLMGWNSLMLG